MIKSDRKDIHHRSTGATTHSTIRQDFTAATLSMVLALGVLLAGNPAVAQDVTASPENTKLEIISPKDGETVSNPVVVKFGLAGMGVAPAGVTNQNTGHHHLIIDAPLPDLDFAIPKDAKHRHFGGGQTQVSLELSPGEHTLQLLLGDYRHIPHDPPVSSKKITITVE